MRQQGSPTPSDSIPHPATAPISIVVRPVLTYGACAHTLGSSESVAVGGDGVGSMNIRVGDRSGEVAISMCVASATERDRSPRRATRVSTVRAARSAQLVVGDVVSECILAQFRMQNSKPIPSGA